VSDEPTSEPVLEPVSGAKRDHASEPVPGSAPTIEDDSSFGSEAMADNGTPTTRRRQYRSRSERRTYRRAARKRKSRFRLWLVVGPALVVIAALVAFLILLGGPEGDVGTVTTLPVVTAVSSDLLVIEQAEAVPLLVLVHPGEGTGQVLAIQGLTLFKTETEGFKTLSELHTSGQDEALSAAVAAALGVSIELVATVQWSDLRAAMVGAGAGNVPPTTLTSEDGEAGQVASALLALIAGGGSGSGAAAWEALLLEGDASGFRRAVKDLASKMSAEQWTAPELAGRLVEGTGFKYVEPDVDGAKASLAGAQGGPAITLQVQNGSGVVGIAEQAGELLEQLGYEMLPAGNSEDFPDVERTRIVVSSDATAEGEQVRALLGVGAVTQDQAFESGQVVVVLGKDYMPPATTTTSTAPAG
jgi:hypothetical protein